MQNTPTQPETQEAESPIISRSNLRAMVWGEFQRDRRFRQAVLLGLLRDEFGVDALLVADILQRIRDEGSE